MQVTNTSIPDLLILNPTVFKDERGHFYESWNKKEFDNTTNLNVNFVQDNHAKSKKGVLRGLHFQLKHPQGKLVRVTSGKVLDVVVDIRKSSNTFGQHFQVVLSGENKKQLWIPEGFAHGYLVLSDTAEFLYKTTGFYMPDDERCIRWNDDDLNIDWGLKEAKPILSHRDKNGLSFRSLTQSLLDF
jgi:dTDP-4-dehydrorhamnose 3,5-epimerase